MKLLQVIPYFCFGGAETMCENLTYALKKMGHTVIVVSLYDRRTPISERMEKAGVEIRYLDKKLGLDVSMVPKLKKIMKELQPDVVHTHLDVIKYAVAAAKLAGVKSCVHTVHNVADQEAEGRAQKLINGFYFRRGWSVPVALSPEIRRSIEAFYGLAEHQVPVIYNGIDLSRCRVKEDYGTDGVTLIHIGRFNPQKNHRGLLEAFSLIQKECPHCRLKLVGDGELRQEMEDYAAWLGIAGQVDFLGNRENVYPELHDADIFLLPSLYEGMPMTIIEAMGTGLPVVASRVGGVPDMFTDGESGFLTDTQPEQIAGRVLELIRSPQLRRRMGSGARQESRRFSAEYMARQYCGVYENRGGRV